MQIRLVTTARRMLTGHNAVCVVTLLAFVTTSIGLPLAPIGLPTAGCQCGSDLQASGQCCCRRAQSGRSLSSCCSASADVRLPGSVATSFRSHAKRLLAGGLAVIRVLSNELWTNGTPSEQVNAKSCCSRSGTRSDTETAVSASRCQSSGDKTNLTGASSCCRSRGGDAEDSSAPSVSACGCGGLLYAGFVMNVDPRILADVPVMAADLNCSRCLPPADLMPPVRCILPETPPPKVCLSSEFSV